jgi:hypothetical protein
MVYALHWHCTVNECNMNICTRDYAVKTSMTMCILMYCTPFKRFIFAIIRRYYILSYTELEQVIHNLYFNSTQSWLSLRWESIPHFCCLIVNSKSLACRPHLSGQRIAYRTSVVWVKKYDYLIPARVGCSYCSKLQFSSSQ